MTRNETIDLLRLLVAAYPSGKLAANEITVGVWHEMLKDLSGELVGAAVRRMIATLKFPPTIADVRAAVAEGVTDAMGVVDAGEAWNRVCKAISWYGYSRGEEARKALGQDIWAGVEMAGGWQYLCLDDGEESVRSAQFERRYAARLAQQTMRVQIPEGVDDRFRELIGELQQRLTEAPSEGFGQLIAAAVERRAEYVNTRLDAAQGYGPDAAKRHEQMLKLLGGDGA